MHNGDVERSRLQGILPFGERGCYVRGNSCKEREKERRGCLEARQGKVSWAEEP